MVPVFLQGTLILWLQRLAPWVGNALLGRFGARMQMRPMPRDPNYGNLFEPVRPGVGPLGSVPPTKPWIRYGATAAILGTLGAAGLGAWRLRRAFA
jgi:hypothetical protein